MKRNALIRIILWSIVFLLLVAILLSILLGTVYNRRHREYQIIEETFQPRKVVWQLTIADPVTVHSAPSLEATQVQILNPGTYVEVLKSETVSGTKWAYLITPVDGWVVWDTLQEDTSAIQETGVSVQLPDAGDTLAFDSNRIREIEIEWLAGDILIMPANTDQILVSETEVSDSKYVMVTKQKDNKLSIAFCQETQLEWGFGINITTDLKKDLTIYVPQNWVCDSLEIDAASAALEVNDLTIREVDFDGASGKCSLDNCTVDLLDVDTASGDISFNGSLNNMDCDAASASVYAVFTNVPSRLDMDSMSGDLDITLPENAGFTVSMDALSSRFSSDFETTMRNNQHIAGDGRCRIQVDAMSGDMIIRKAG